MSQPFLEFFERIRDRNEYIEAPGDAPVEEEGEEVVEVRSPDILSLEDSDDGSGDVHDVDWDDVKRSNKIGPLLSTLREEQEKQPMTQRESYSIEHLKRLYQFVPARPYSKPRANKLCAKVHPKPCPYGCKSCHFCRQRSTEPKTVCSVCDGVNNYYGGPARGYWCGSCLWLRIGENIDEVRGRKDWVCPACRDICNCSGANCMRIKRGWFPTNQLSHEAKEQGYKSVAHYLVLTHLSEQASAAPIDQLLGRERRRRKKPALSHRSVAEEEPAHGGESVPSRRRPLRQAELPLQFKGDRTRRKALEIASKPRLEKEIAEIVHDLGAPEHTSIFTQLTAGLNETSKEPGNISKFLCILDDDLKDIDEEEEEQNNQLQGRVSEKIGIGLPVAEHEDIPPSALYPSSASTKYITRVSTIESGPRKRQKAPKVGASLLPPKRPRGAITTKESRKPSDPSHLSPTKYNGNEEEDNMINLEEDKEETWCSAELEGENISPVAKDSVSHEDCRAIGPTQQTGTPQKSIHRNFPIPFTSYQPRNLTYMDEFVWNSLCLRAMSIIDAVKTFYKFHPDVSDSYKELIDETTDREIYDNMYECTQGMLQKLLRSAESLVTEDVTVKYCPDETEEIRKSPGTLTSVGGVRRAVELLTYLSRILPEDDVIWRIEKRLLGSEPFIDFESSSPHTKALLLRGRLELVAILEKRRICGPVALQNIGDTLGSIANDMKAALPLLDAIVENKIMPVDDCSISGWTYNDHMRGRKLVEVFTDLSVMYASLHEVLLLGIDRATELCRHLGIKSHHILTGRLTDTLFNVSETFPKGVMRSAFTLLCTMIEIGRETCTNENVGMTAEERNMVITDRKNLVQYLGSEVVPRLECLVQKDYNLWGRSRLNVFTEKCRTEGLGSEKVEVLARCYALQIQSNTVSWSAIESKATEPYSFSQYWKYANLRYRNFSLYLLAHTLENAPDVLKSEMNLPSILRMWLLSVLDFGRHECSWYLTTILSRHTSGIIPPLHDGTFDFRSDAKGTKRGALLRYFGEAVMKGQLRHRLPGILLLLDECLEERRREIIQTSFNADKALLKWQRSVMQAILHFLDPLTPLMSSSMPAGKELRKLFRRCAIWTIEGFWNIQKRCSMNASRLSSPCDGGASDLDMLSTEGDIRQELESGACGTLREFMQLANILRIDTESSEGTEVEFLEPLWIVISGIIEMSNGDTVITPFDIALFDKVSASIFEVKMKENERSNALDLHQYILATHIRRYILKANHRNQSSEKFAVNALRLAYALFSRPEMRSIQSLQACFNLMMTTWIGIFSQAGDGDSLAVRHELLHQLQFVLTSHPGIVPIHGKARDQISSLYEVFWRTVSREALRMVTSRFPQTILSGVSLEAEYLYSQILPSIPGLELFKPNTPQSLSESYNNALGVLGRPPSLDMVEILHSNKSMGDIIPRVFSQKQQDLTLTSFRPGDFGWTLAKKSITFLDVVANVSVGEGRKGCSSPDAPGAWYSFCCLPFLESLCRKGERATLLIDNERKMLIKSLQMHLPDIQVILQRAEPAMTDRHDAGTTQQVGKASQVPRSADPMRCLGDIDTFNIGDLFSIESRLMKVRKIEKDGMRVAVCVLSDAKLESSALNVLISKPKDLVDSLLDTKNTENLPAVIRLKNIQFARHGVNSQAAVARSTPDTSIEHWPAHQRPEMLASGEQSPFIDASRKLTQMGYSPAEVMMCIRRIQRETQGAPVAPTSTSIVSKVIEQLHRH